MYSIAALMPLIDAQLTEKPRPGIMLYSFATVQAEEIYREISEAEVDAIYIAGGPSPLAMPDEALQYFDYVVIGEGEETLPELIDALKKGKDPGKVKGIAYKEDGKPIYTGKREPVNLDLYPPFQKPIISPIEISRGCPWKCAYCQTPQLFGAQMRHRSVPIIKNYARFHKDIRFTSPNSLAFGSDGLMPKLGKVEFLLKSLAELKKPIYFGTFPCEVRPEFISHYALELITTYCANRTVNIGSQSGSDKVLNAIGRGHSIEQVEIACDLCLDHGIVQHLDLIFGLPMDSALDQRLTLDLAKKIIHRGGKVRAHYFMPLPGTHLARTKPAPLVEDVAGELGRLAQEGKLTGSWMVRCRTAERASYTLPEARI